MMEKDREGVHGRVPCGSRGLARSDTRGNDSAVIINKLFDFFEKYNNIIGQRVNKQLWKRLCSSSS